MICPMRRVFFAFFFLAFSFHAFSERVISPVPGDFANRQALVLDLSDGAEAFYSYSGLNPLVSGFAYDGPVLIDAAGEVTVHVVVVSGDSSEEHEIVYTVSEPENPFADGSAEKAFVDRIAGEGILFCDGGNMISIPGGLDVTVGDGEGPVMRGAVLSVSADNRLARYVPCSVTDGDIRWRFIVFVSGGEAGTFARSEVPFEISGWSEFRFTGKNLIWRIDDGMWSASRESVELDRSRTHVVYWQDVAYEQGNPIQSFVLPQRPSIQKDSYDKAVVFTVSGDPRYRLSVSSSGAEGEAPVSSGLYASLTFDAFDGDCVSAEAVFDVYCDGVYQGELSSSYVIDRRPPLPPRFIASEAGAYARRDVSLTVAAEEDAEIYLSVYGPFELDAASYLDQDLGLERINPDEKDYFLYKSQPVELRSGLERTVCYKAFAYARDSSGNVSDVSVYQVVIDEYNYFLDGSAAGLFADGSRLHPYNSFEQALRVINEGKFAHFFVSGEIPVPKGVSIISSNCSFTGTSGARFVLSPSSVIIVRNASLEMQNCVVQKDAGDGQAADTRLFVFEAAAASFEDCEISGDFGSSGTALSSEASMISLKNSGLTSQARAYACAFSGLNSRAVFEGCHFASISGTAVNFSLKGGSFELRRSGCKVISHLGRILEATGTNLRLVSNTYTGDFDGPAKGVSAVWRDEKSMILEDKDNISEGFGK